MVTGGRNKYARAHLLPYLLNLNHQHHDNQSINQPNNQAPALTPPPPSRPRPPIIIRRRS